MFERLNESCEEVITTSALELVSERMDLKPVFAKAMHEPVPLEQVSYVVSRDFGFRNTLAHVVVKLDQTSDVVRLREITTFATRTPARSSGPRISKQLRSSVRKPRSVKASSPVSMGYRSASRSCRRRSTASRPGDSHTSMKLLQYRDVA